jgi:hypothetical protein
MYNTTRCLYYNNAAIWRRRKAKEEELQIHNHWYGKKRTRSLE